MYVSSIIFLCTILELYILDVILTTCQMLSNNFQHIWICIKEIYPKKNILTGDFRKSMETLMVIKIQRNYIQMLWSYIFILHITRVYFSAKPFQQINFPVPFFLYFFMYILVRFLVNFIPFSTFSRLNIFREWSNRDS